MIIALFQKFYYLLTYLLTYLFRGHSKSLVIAPIDRDIGRKSPILTYPTYIWRLRWGDPLEFRIGIISLSVVAVELQ